MMAMSHVVIGGSAWGLAVATGVGTHDPRAFALAIFGSLLPDIDHPKSWLGRKVPFLSVPISALFGHRGITHSLLAISFWLFVMTTQPGWMGLPLALGYLSHLLADSLTPAGVPLLWPVKKRFGVSVCTTGSPAETLVVAVVAGGAVWLGLGKPHWLSLHHLLS